ncbi:hypothetical protein [Microbispora amethystogenes]|uniref:Uncharacterized protein n=1 Tax=Microbispora amethystogenes TaxID=1427754 RepID=A0ABQ4FMB5_9ACTN|nr:hypothetical protein [Microbispora amethystogenes]GIH35955.1 hypothetical protein Mam01_61190 [Microbispora amethystogenes]
MSRRSEPTVIRQPARSNRVLAPVAAFVIGAVVAGGVVFAATRPDATEQAVNRIRAEDAVRDKAQIKELTELARTTRDKLVPVLEGLERVMPVEGDAAFPAAVPSAAPSASAEVGKPEKATGADIANWRQATAAAVQSFADPPSGETYTNLARSGLASGVRQLATTVDSYVAAQALTGPARTNMLALAARQRMDAIFTWSVGATALDAVSVDAGSGHQHVYLPAAPGSGALTADDSEEGH